MSERTMFPLLLLVVTAIATCVPASVMANVAPAGGDVVPGMSAPHSSASMFDINGIPPIRQSSSSGGGGITHRRLPSAAIPLWGPTTNRTKSSGGGETVNYRRWRKRKEPKDPKGGIGTNSSSDGGGGGWCEALSPYEYHAAKGQSSEEEKEEEGTMERPPMSGDYDALPAAAPVHVHLDFFDGLVKLLALLFWTSMDGSAGGGGGGGGGLFSWLSGSPPPPYMPKPRQHYAFELMNKRHVVDRAAIGSTLVSSYGRYIKILRGEEKRRKKREFRSRLRKLIQNKPSKEKRTVIVLELNTDDETKRDGAGGGQGLDKLSDRVSFLQSAISDPIIKREMGNVEVVVVLESSGGAVSDFGLAASQLSRLRSQPPVPGGDGSEGGHDGEATTESAGVTLTMCVDKVAASGGYMIACQASPGQLLAAPWSIVGSIGVISASLNYKNLLEKYGVRPFVFKAGKDKQNLNPLGEVTKEDAAKEQRKLDEFHESFRSYVAMARPHLVDRMDRVATGDVWIGQTALEKGLVDRLVTSDAYLWERLEAGDRVLRLCPYDRGPRLFGFGGGRSGGGLWDYISAMASWRRRWFVAWRKFVVPVGAAALASQLAASCSSNPMAVHRT